jgi:hypothetical protein
MILSDITKNAHAPRLSNDLVTGAIQTFELHEEQNCNKKLLAPNFPLGCTFSKGQVDLKFRSGKFHLPTD